MHNILYENEFYLHVNENSLLYESMCTKIRLEKEVQDNSEMAYSSPKNNQLKPLVNTVVQFCIFGLS